MVDYQHPTFTKFASETGCLTGNHTKSALYENMVLHPTEKMGAGAFEQDERRRLQTLSVNYGSHMAMRAVIDRNMFASQQRMGNIGSAFALQGAMGRIYSLDETDIYNDPRESPFLDKEGLHARVEKVYGL